MTSFVDNIPAIVRAVVNTGAKNILDVGPGFGKYGLLIREALLSNIAEDKKEQYPAPDFKISACESSLYFQSQPALLQIYDRIFPWPIKMMTDEELNSYDLILLIDVIEHWTKEEYLKFLSRVSPSTKILISTPKEVFFYTIEYYGSDVHKTQYSDFDFDSGENLSTKDSFIYLL